MPLARTAPFAPSAGALLAASLWQLGTRKLDDRRLFMAMAVPIMAAGSCCHTFGCLSLLAKSCHSTGRSVLALATAVLCLQPAREALLLSITIKLKAISFNRMLSGPIKAAKTTPGISSTRFNATSAATSAGQYAANKCALGAALTKSSARVRNQINARARSQSLTQASINVAIELKLQQLPCRTVPCRTQPHSPLLLAHKSNQLQFVGHHSAHTFRLWPKRETVLLAY